MGVGNGTGISHPDLSAWKAAGEVGEGVRL